MLKLLVFLFKAAKLSKILLTSGTMLLSVFAYSLLFGWRYATGFVLLIFVHEMGHYVAARQRGLDVGAPTFIPFVGAWIQLKEMPHDVETEAYVGMAGPLAGTFGALACYFMARQTGSDLLLALSYAGFFINLFNLIPVSPLDGGRITAAISPRVWLLGAPVLVGAFVLHPSPLLIMIAILAVPQLQKAWHFRADDPANGDYYKVSTETRMSYGLLYMGMVIFLALMTQNLHQMLAAVRATH